MFEKKKNQSQVKVPWYLFFGRDYGMPYLSWCREHHCLFKSTLFSLQILPQMLPGSRFQSFPGGKTLVGTTLSRSFGQHVCPDKSN